MQCLFFVFFISFCMGGIIISLTNVQWQVLSLYTGQCPFYWNWPRVRLKLTFCWIISSKSCLLINFKAVQTLQQEQVIVNHNMECNFLPATSSLILRLMERSSADVGKRTHISWNGRSHPGYHSESISFLQLRSAGYA